MKGNVSVKGDGLSQVDFHQGFYSIFQGGVGTLQQSQQFAGYFGLTGKRRRRRSAEDCGPAAFQHRF